MLPLRTSLNVALGEEGLKKELKRYAMKSRPSPLYHTLGGLKFISWRTLGMNLILPI